MTPDEMRRAAEILDSLTQQPGFGRCPDYAPLARLLREEADSQGWQPIDTAPRDSGRLLVAYKNLCGEWRVHEAWWCTPWEGAPDKNCYWRHDGDVCMLDASIHGVGASHWRPLPPPPQGREG